MTNQSFSIAIIGAGFSGALLAVQLLRRCREGDRVYLVEKRAGFGRGLAYSTSNINHLLNVRAGNMSAFQDQPDHFVKWLRSRADDGGEDAAANAITGPDSFVSRRLYGTYIRSLLCDELWQGGKGRNLFLVPDQAVALNVEPGGAFLTVAGGRCYRVDTVVLAAGNLPPDEIRGAYFGNPWNPDATSGLGRDDKVLLIGSGLTMVDTVQTLIDSGHRGPIQALSRRGLVPHVHVPTDPLEISTFDLPRTTSVARLARWLRKRVEAAEAEGRTWRDVIDGLRPHLQDLWRRLSVEERRRFLRHLRPWWDIHRHRMAPPVAAMLEAAMDRGQLVIERGRIVEIASQEASVVVRWRRRGASLVETMKVSRAINCSGPETNYTACSDPLIRDLLARRFVRPDPLGLGLEVNEQGALLNHEGIPSRRLFALGPVTRGSFWEIVAVPDIRQQCARLANHLVAQYRANVEAGDPQPVRPPVAAPAISPPPRPAPVQPVFLRPRTSEA